LEGHSATRGLFEFVIRRRTLSLPNVTFKTGMTVSGLEYRDGRIRGVSCGANKSIEAELVVDAGGRGSRAPQWLTAIGFPRPGILPGKGAVAPTSAIGRATGPLSRSSQCDAIPPIFRPNREARHGSDHTRSDHADRYGLHGGEASVRRQ
jgi:hypothetical protein